MPFATPMSALRSTFSLASTCWAKVIQHTDTHLPDEATVVWSTHRIRPAAPSGGVLKRVLIRLALLALRFVHVNVLLRTGSPLPATPSVPQLPHRCCPRHTLPRRRRP